jgi:hypothetical protein
MEKQDGSTNLLGRSDNVHAANELPRTLLPETVWKIAGEILIACCLVAQGGEMGHLCPVLATRYTPEIKAYSDFPDSLSSRHFDE